MLKLKNLLSMLLVLAAAGVASAQALPLEFTKNSLRKEKDESAHVIDLNGAPGTEGADWNKLRVVDVRLKSLGLPGTLFLFVNDEPVDSIQLKGEANELNDLSVKVPSTVRPPIRNVSLRLRGWFSLVDGKIAVTLRFGEGAAVPNPVEPKPEPKPLQPKPQPPVVEPIVPPAGPPERPVVTPKPTEPKEPRPTEPKEPRPTEPKPTEPKPVVPKPKPVEPRPPVVTPRPPVATPPRPPVVTPRPPVDDGRCYKGFCPGDHVMNDLGLSGTVVGIGPDPSGLRPGKCILVKWSFARDRAPACRFPGEIDKP